MQIMKIISGVAVSTLAGVGVSAIAKRTRKCRKHKKENQCEVIPKEEPEDIWKSIGDIFNSKDKRAWEEGMNKQIMLFGLTNRQVYLIKKALCTSAFDVYVSEDRHDIYRSNADLIIANYERLEGYEITQLARYIKYRYFEGDVLLIKDLPEFIDINHVFVNEKLFDDTDKLKEEIEKGVVRSLKFNRIKTKIKKLHYDMVSLFEHTCPQRVYLVKNYLLETDSVIEEIYSIGYK